jgi:hypothetical protein
MKKTDLIAYYFMLIPSWAYSPTQKIEICSSETSAEFHWNTLCYIPEDRVLLKVLSRQQNVATSAKEISR